MLERFSPPTPFSTIRPRVQFVSREWAQADAGQETAADEPPRTFGDLDAGVGVMMISGACLAFWACVIVVSFWL
jgi:hypothetical protein